MHKTHGPVRKAPNLGFPMLLTFIFGSPLVIIVLLFWLLSDIPEMDAVNARFPVVEAAVYTKYIGIKDFTIPAAIRKIMEDRAPEVEALLDSTPRARILQEYKQLKNTWIFTYARSVVKISISLAVFALGVGGCALLFMREARKQSLKSRKALFSWFSHGKRLLPIFMIGASLPLILAMLGAAVTGIMIRYGWGNADPGIIIVGLLLVVVCLGMILLQNIIRFLRRILTASDTPIPGTLLDRKNAPAIWSMVEDISRKTSLPLPDKIQMGFTDGFFVAAQNVLEDSEKSRNGKEKFNTVLYLSIPIMLVLEENELRAIIGHELAHIQEKDLEYRVRFSNAYKAVCHAFETLVPGPGDTHVEHIALGAARQLALFFLRSFELADMHWSRIREAAADKIGIRAASSRDAALALVRSAMYGPALFEYVAAVRCKGGKLEGGLLNGLHELVTTMEVRSLTELREEEQPHPLDSHPTLAERLEGLNIAEDVNLETEARAIRPGKLLRALGI